MAEVQAEVKKPKTEVEIVQMEDGRTVGFAGNRKMDKNYLIDDSKIQVEEDGTVLFGPGAIKVRIDFRNGKTILHSPAPKLLATYAGHGGIQKLGDDAAGIKDVDDAFMAIEELSTRLEGGEWGATREAGDGFAGASIVVRAIMEHQTEQGKPMTQEQVKAFLQKKLDDAKGRGESLSRKQLYDAFRNPNSKIGQKIERMEKEKLSKDSKLDADAALAEIS